MSHRLQLSISGKGFTNLAGLLQTSDPFAVVTVRGDSPDNRPLVVGQTEVVYNNLNPQWATVIILEGYKFGVPLYFEVGVFDFQARAVGRREQNLATRSSEEDRVITSTESTRNLLRTGKLPHKVMGTALFEVGEILGSKGNLASKKIQKGGVVYVHVERSHAGMSGKIKFQLRGLNLSNTRSLGRKSSPFFELYRKVDKPQAVWNSVYRSNVVKNCLSPKWDASILSLEAVCNGDMERAMKVVVKDHRRNGKHIDMGEFETSMRGIVEVKEEGGDLDEDKGFTLARGGKDTGQILVLHANIQKENKEALETVAEEQRVTPSSRNIDRPAFVDYITGGCEISLAVAIDFTASNGDPREEGTLHYFYPPASREWNDYQKAIFAVGNILAKYDSNQLFPVWGFGAKYHNVTRHCFQCGSEIEVHGVQGIMEAYRGVFNTTLTMSFPTVFTEVIKTASRYAEHEHEAAEEEGKLSYTILLILTAGNVEDVQETKQELIAASEVPLSVVIVGIGDKDFDGMEFLDEFDPSVETGRDITKFVRFNDYKSYNKLTEAVLDEIPDQLVEFYYSRGILPGQAEDVDRETVEIRDADDEERTINFLG